MSDSNSIRLQKFMASCGLGSRRFCETLITSGRVKVDNEIIKELGTRVDPSLQKIECNGIILQTEPMITIMLNKPPKVICTSNDPKKRTTVIDLLSDLPERVYTIGRLDFMSEGLILVTNNGELAHTLMHPKNHIEKTYNVWLDEPLGYFQMKKSLKGVYDKNELLRFKEINEVKHTRQGVLYNIILEEGRNRHIRRVIENFGKKIYRLQRTHIGPLHMESLKLGEWRCLKPSEMKILRKYISKNAVDSEDE